MGRKSNLQSNEFGVATLALWRNFIARK